MRNHLVSGTERDAEQRQTSYAKICSRGPQVTPTSQDPQGGGGQVEGCVTAVVRGRSGASVLEDQHYLLERGDHWHGHGEPLEIDSVSWRRSP